MSKSLKNYPTSFPRLTEPRLLSYYRENLDEYRLGKAIRSLLALRAITRLAIPPLRDNNVMESLETRVSYLEAGGPLSHDCAPLILAADHTTHPTRLVAGSYKPRLNSYYTSATRNIYPIQMFIACNSSMPASSRINK